MSDTEIAEVVNNFVNDNPMIANTSVIPDPVKALKEVTIEAPDFVVTDIEFLRKSTLRGMCFMFPVIVVGHCSDCAVDAFDYRAFDFLLAPVNADRLNAAMSRVLRELSGRLRKQNQSLLAKNYVLGDPRPQRERRKLVIKETGRIRLINQESIRYVKGAGNYVEIFLNNNCKIMHRATLKSIENKLDPVTFCRIHKSTLINLNMVEELRPRSKGDYCVRLEGGDSLLLSRNNKDKLELLMEQDDTTLAS